MIKSKLKRKIEKYNQANLEKEKKESKEKEEQEVVDKFVQDKFIDKYGSRLWIGGFFLSILIAYFTAYTSFFNDGLIRFFVGLFGLIIIFNIIKFCLESKIKANEDIE